MNHPNLISQICLNCTAGFVVLECANFVEETGTCEGCEVAHCCRQCGSHDTRPKTSEEIKAMQELLASGMYVPVERALYRCGDCGLEFTQRQCASHTGDGTTCMYDCECKGADKDDVHRCPMCFTLNGHYAGPALLAKAPQAATESPPQAAYGCDAACGRSKTIPKE